MKETHIPQSSRNYLRFRAQSLSHLAFILVLVLAFAGPIAAQVAPPVGPYGVVLNTTFSDPSTQGGVGFLGIMNFDGAGNVSGPYTFEIGSVGGHQGGTATGTLTGTYSSNPDGTGTVSVTLDIGLNATLAMVINGGGRSLQLALTSCSGLYCDLSGSVNAGVGEAIFNGATHPVHTGLLNGSYGMQSTKSSPTPQTSVEVWSFDGAGNVQMSGTYVAPGPTVANGVLQGTYSVNPDGTGTITIPPQTGQPAGKTFVFVITNGHSGLLVLQTNRAGNGVLYEIGRLQ
jgi:hypothetical protein